MVVTVHNTTDYITNQSKQRVIRKEEKEVRKRQEEKDKQVTPVRDT